MSDELTEHLSCPRFGERDVSGYYDRDATVDYWDGEE